MSPKEKSSHNITTISIKQKSLTSFQFLKMATGKPTLQLLEEITNALDVINSRYYETVLLKKQRLNVEVRRSGSQITISIIPKLSVKEKPCKPITARFDRKGNFKGVVET